MLGAAGWRLGLVAAFGLAFGAVLLQFYAGWPVAEDSVLEVTPTSARDGFGVRVNVPKRYRSDATDLRAVVLYDGLPIGLRVPGSRAVRVHGSGRYRVSGKHIWLSMPDNSDPREAGGEFILRAPRPVRIEWPVGLLVGLLFSVWWAGRDGRAREFGAALAARLDGVPPVAIPLAAALVAAGIAVTDTLGEPVVHDTTFSVNGMPYSDAMGWNELAISFAEGGGMFGDFAAQRPFHPVMLGALYMVVGPSVEVALFFNAAVWAATAFFLSSLGLVVRSRTVALVLGGFVAFSAFHRQMAGQILTEELGTVLALASLLVFVLAAVRAPGGGRPMPAYFASGLLLGFANLARPLTLLAAPLLVGVVVLAEAGVGSGALGRSWKRALLGVVALALGSLLVVAPWLLRQKLVHGITTISSTSADLLYAGTLDEGWGVPIFEERDAAGADANIQSQVEFFMRRFRENVTGNPARYLERVAGNFVGFFEDFETGSPRAMLVTVLVALAVSLGVSVWLRTGAGLLAFAGLWPVAVVWRDTAPLIYFLAAVGVVWWRGGRTRRLVLAAVVATLVGNALLSALVGNFGLSRMAGLRDGLMLFVVTLGLLEIVLCVAGWIARSVSGWQREGVPVPVPKTVALAAYGSLALCLAATAAVGGRQLTAGELPDRTEPISAAERGHALEWLAAESPGNGAIASGAAGAGLSVMSGEHVFAEVLLFDYYHAEIAANEDVGHWSNAFTPRAYDRTVWFARRGLDVRRAHDLAIVEFPEVVRGIEGAHLVIGVRNENPDAELGFDTLLVEALALVPWSERDGLDFGAARVFTPSPEAEAVMAGWRK